MENEEIQNKVKNTQQRLKELGYIASEELAKLIMVFEEPDGR